jgi:hypothetical protein
MRIKMLHDHERHSRARRQTAQQFHRRFESAGRVANADDGAIYIFLRRLGARCLPCRFRAEQIFSDSMLFARAVHLASQPWLPFMLLAAFP